MRIIEIQPLSNGAHRNQRSDCALPVPDGWIAVPKTLEAEAQGYLPFIELTITDGVLTAVAQGPIPEPEPEPEPEIPELTLEARVADCESSIDQIITGLEALA